MAYDKEKLYTALVEKTTALVHELRHPMPNPFHRARVVNEVVDMLEKIKKTEVEENDA